MKADLSKPLSGTNSYGAQDIEVLEGLEPVRKRPGMFIAGTDTPAGLHQLVFEILDNCVDEAMNGYANQIKIILHADKTSVTISDNGRGIPVEKHPKFKKSTLEVILTTLHAGGKFSDKNYKTAGGLHGVGSSVVNALSEELIARVRRDGKEYEQCFKRGLAKGPLKIISSNVKETGTTIFFRPDPEIFSSIKFSTNIIATNAKTKAYLNPGLKLYFEDQSSGTKEEYFYPEGLIAYLKQLLEQRQAKIIADEVFFIAKDGDVPINMAFAWTDSTKEEFLSYANGIHTVDGGSHELGAKSAIVRSIRNYINVHDLQLKGLKIGSEDIREGLLCLVSVNLPGGKYQIQFQGQTKSKLNNPEITPIVESTARNIEQLLNEKPSVAEAIISRVTLAAKARAASREAETNVRRKIGVSHRLNLPGKLADCSSNRQDQTELFIVEGDSAGGSAKQGRSRNFQAVLALRGKVLNTIASPGKKVLENAELSNIVAALGCGVGDTLKIDKLRYGKVIILTDADADGMHIATLLMGFFFRHMPKIIDHQSLFLGKPPLYGIFPKGHQSPKKKGKQKAKTDAFWAYSDEELQTIIKKNNLNAPRIVRYKGLGEMNPETLWETTLNPESRTLLRICMADKILVEQALSNLMGNDPSKRYELIQQNAHRIEVDV